MRRLRRILLGVLDALRQSSGGGGRADLRVARQRRKSRAVGPPEGPVDRHQDLRVSKTGAFRTTKAGPRTAQSQYDTLIEENAAVHGVSPHLVRAVIQQESAFNPNARSHKGAMGLMQLMPATAAELGVTNPYSPSENIRGGVTYLKGLLMKFAQNVELALAAYNAGPTP